jgi:3-methyladenine DNA glycosylase AlkD
MSTGNLEATSFADGIAAQLRAQKAPSAATLHKLRRSFSKQLASQPAETLLAIAFELLERPGVPGARLIACALVGNHRAALCALDDRTLERLGAGMASWGDVDIFGCLVAGRAWRDGKIKDATIKRWAHSPERWWRRAALVATVPLNVRAQGGSGDGPRTLAVCKLLAADADDLVVKALSWSLRELTTHEPAAVRGFLKAHDAVLSARVKREVRNKLETGLKNPRS